MVKKKYLRIYLNLGDYSCNYSYKKSYRNNVKYKWNTLKENMHYKRKKILNCRVRLEKWRVYINTKGMRVNN